MNSINFLGQDQFPLSSETMDFLQQMIFLTKELSGIANDGNYILSGCVESGMSVSEGFVLINGEILPFAGGSKQPMVFIHEVRDGINASGYEFPQAYITRTVEFGIGDEPQRWDSFKPILTNTRILEEFARINEEISKLVGVPAGVICMWSGSISKIPTGWALCDGLSGRPNLLGRFVVGYDQSDSDYNSIGKQGGTKKVTLSVNEMPKHDHEIKFTNQKWGDNANRRPFPNKYGTESYTVGTPRTQDTGGSQAHENRPPYYVLAYIIKL